jgi:hypothetical protein
LQETNHTEPVIAALTHGGPPEQRPRRRLLRWFGCLLLVFCLLLAVLLSWLNGPGLRWLGPKIATHFLEQAGIKGELRVEGSLTEGISIADLRLESDGVLRSLTVGRATPDYRILELVKGRVRGLTVISVQADLNLDAEDEDAEREPLDLQKLVNDLRLAREHFLRVGLDLRDVGVTATKGGEQVVALAPTHLRHEVGSGVLVLDLGAITDPRGQVWPARTLEIRWDEEELSIPRIELLPGTELRALVIALPGDAGPSVEAELHIDDAVLALGISPGLDSIQLDLREGRLDSQRIAEKLDLADPLPASATLTSLSLNIDGFLPDPQAASGALRLLLEDLSWDEWQVPELALDLTVDPGRAALAASGRALGTGFALATELPLQFDESGIRLESASGSFEVVDPAAVVGALADQIPAINPEAVVPVAGLTGEFQVEFAQLTPTSAKVSAILKPAKPEDAATLFIDGGWSDDQTLSGGLRIEGLSLTGGYHLETTIYQGELEADGFEVARIDPWLAIVGAGGVGDVRITGSWSGDGDIHEQQHRGRLSLVSANLDRRHEIPPIEAAGELEYDWPSGFAIRDLHLESEDQTITADAKMAAGMLEISTLGWTAGETQLASGSASLPVPEDFSKWRELLTHDDREVTVALESTTLPLIRLGQWIPAAAQIAPETTGLLRLNVSGTYSTPELDASLDVKGLRSPEQPGLPSTDLSFTIAGRDGRLKIDGRADAPDFPPAVMTASMAFRPGEWAEDPQLITRESLSARVDLPRIELSRFTSLVPGMRRLSGTLSGNVEVAGELGAPAVQGRIDLSNALVEMNDQRIPTVTGVSGALRLNPERVALENLRGLIAGGTLQASGTLAIQEGKPGPIDFRLSGRQVPVLRDDSLIIRSNLDLRLAGTIEQASLTGSLEVVDSLFYRDIELLPIGTPFTGPSAAALPRLDAPANPAAAIPEPFRNWTLDVRARTANPLLIRGNFATGSVRGDLRASGTLGAPSLVGEVNISNLKAALPFSTLTVPSGTLRFTPATGLDPILEIRGNAEPRPYRVNLIVYGRASDPQLVLTSNPPLPANEIMTLLATGTTTSGLENPQAASSRAIQLFAEELRRGRVPFGRQLRPLLGLFDRVDFSLAEEDPYSTESFSTATLSLTDSWLLSAGMGADGDSRVMGVWRLTFR